MLEDHPAPPLERGPIGDIVAIEEDAAAIHRLEARR